MTVTILCAGPGPHDPASGILGTADRPVSGMRCNSPSCVVPPTTAMVNAQTLEQRAQTALTNNQTFLAIASPTNAQAVTQVQALTRQINGVIRLMQGLLDQITDS